MSQTTVNELEPVQVTNKYNLTELKNAVDDEISRYYSKEQKFSQSHIHTDFKLVLGFVSCAIAGGAFLYEYKTSFNEAFTVTTICIIVYWFLQTIGLAHSYLIQKDELFFGIQKLNGKSAATLKVFAKTEKNSPKYELELNYIDKVTGKKSHFKVSPNITSWFNSNGTLVREAMDKDLEGYLSALKQKLHEN